MIARLTDEQIASMWPLIEDVVDRTMPVPVHGMAALQKSNLLVALLTDQIECWAGYDKDLDDKKIVLRGLSLISLSIEAATGARIAYIHALAQFIEGDESIWEESFSALYKYAKSRGCCMINCHSNVPALIKRAEQFGGATDYKLISFPIEH